MIFLSTPQIFTFSSRGRYTPSGVYQRKTTTIVTLYVKTSFDTCTLIGPDAFYVIPRGDLRLATCDEPVHITDYDFKDSTGEFSKYRKTLTYKVCDAVHTCPPQIARPIYVNVSKYLPIYVLARYGVDRAYSLAMSQ